MTPHRAWTSGSSETGPSVTTTVWRSGDAAAAVRVGFAFAAAKLLLHLPILTRYGQHRDEYYFRDCARFLDFGYVDHAPLTPWLLWLTEAVLGDSLFAMRLPAALAGAVTVYLGAHLVARLGGGAFAASLCCMAILFAPAYLRMAAMLNIVVFEPLFWTIAVLLLLRALESPRTQRWLALGGWLGLALLNKHTAIFWAAAMALALALSSRRRILATPGPWLAAAVALAVFAPNLVWQVQNDFATLEFLRNMRDGTLASIPRSLFGLGQILYIGPLAAPIWLAGLWSLARDRRPEHRLLAVHFAILFAFFLWSHAKPYYLAPAYPPLLAAGAVYVGARWSVAARGALATLLVASGVGMALISLPILPIDELDRGIERVLGAIVPARALTHDMHDQFGWRELSQAVAAANASLTPDERRTAIVIGRDYGVVSSVRHFAAELELPPAYGGNMTHYLWGPPSVQPSAVIAVGLAAHHLAAVCKAPEIFLRVTHPIAETDGLVIHICRDPNDIASVWPLLKKYYHGNQLGDPARELSDAHPRELRIPELRGSDPRK